MMITRRSALLGTTALVAISCAVAGLTLAQAIADTQGIITTLQTDEPLMATLFPKVVTPAVGGNVLQWLGQAASLLTGIGAQSPVAVTNMQSALTDINLVLTDLATLAGYAAAADPQIAALALVVEAAIALAPEAEQLITSLLGSVKPLTGGVYAGKPLAALRAAVAPSMSPAQARAYLKVPTV